MSEQILTTLKRKLDDLAAYGELDAETRRNALKEELQFYVLNFIYHEPEYSKWIMYGGSALHIIHGLDRMSVDLDFEVSQAITEKFLDELKKKIEGHFTSTYGTGPDFLTIKTTTGRGLLLKFHVGEELSFGHPSKQVHIKIDLNHFVAPKTVHERRPINQDQLSFVIVTYNMSALMASKIAAIFLRGTRGVGEAVYEEKGRDIYDLLWYMNKKVVPDFDYLVAKGIDIKDPRALFDKLTLQMNKVNDENLKQDLIPLFTNRPFIENWLKNWRESYLRLLDDYKIKTATTLDKIRIFHWVNIGKPDEYHFEYWYKTSNEGGLARIVYRLHEDCIIYGENDVVIEDDATLEKLIEFSSNAHYSRTEAEENKLRRYATLFSKKNKGYLRKTKGVIVGDVIATKVIRMTADNFNPNEQIVLNKSTLLSCELDDLLK